MVANHFSKKLLIITLAGMGLVLFTHVLRGCLPDPLPAAGFILGVLPNFGAGLGLPGVVYILAGLIFGPEKTRARQRISMLLAAAIAVIALFDWELVQFFAWDYPIDLYDLLASLAGGAAVLALWLTKPEEKSDPRPS